jgi:predicted AlkP superfamily phosphohydrolase/phosphomutase
MKRTIWIGIDGAPYSFLRQAMDRGVLPNLKRFREHYYFGRMNAPFPDNSAVSWSSIITGTTPGEHGIFGFTDLIPGTYTLSFPNFRSLRQKPFWLFDESRRSIVINVPFTYPAAPLNGTLVAGFVAPDLLKASYPSSFGSFLRRENYRIDVDSKKAHKSRELFWEDLLAVHEKHVEVYRHLFTGEQWDNFMIVFTGTDRVGHFLWDACEDKAEPWYSRILEYYSRVDCELGWILENIDENDIVVCMSDHGMERIRTDVYLNTLLQKHGYLSLRESDRPNYTHITPDTKAFALEPSRIYLNMQGRYPNGSVANEQRDELIAELKRLFGGLEYDGKKVIRRVYTREQLYHGDAFERAPDIVLEQETGFSLRGSLGRPDVFATPGILTGVHRGTDAFFAANRDAETIEKIMGSVAATETIAPLVNSLQTEKYARAV